MFFRLLDWIIKRSGGAAANRFQALQILCFAFPFMVASVWIVFFGIPHFSLKTENSLYALPAVQQPPGDMAVYKGVVRRTKTYRAVAVAPKLLKDVLDLSMSGSSLTTKVTPDNHALDLTATDSDLAHAGILLEIMDAAYDHRLSDFNLTQVLRHRARESQVAIKKAESDTAAGTSGVNLSPPERQASTAQGPIVPVYPKKEAAPAFEVIGQMEDKTDTWLIIQMATGERRLKKVHRAHPEP
jgi:hypothetical protein